jgi:hypothetical protein
MLETLDRICDPDNDGPEEEKAHGIARDGYGSPVPLPPILSSFTVDHGKDDTNGRRKDKYYESKFWLETHLRYAGL